MVKQKKFGKVKKKLNLYEIPILSLYQFYSYYFYDWFGYLCEKGLQSEFYIPVNVTTIKNHFGDSYNFVYKNLSGNKFSSST